MPHAPQLELRERVLTARVEQPGLRSKLENPPRLVQRPTRPEIAARGALPGVLSHAEFEPRRATPHRVAETSA